MSARKALTPLAALAGAGAAMAPDEAEATFIGEKGAAGMGRSVLEGLDAAKEMLRKGELKRVVHKLTGWSIGADGKWRYEVDDSSSRMMPNSIAAAAARSNMPVNQILKHDELFQLYPDRPLKNVEVNVGVGDDPTDFGGAYYHGVGSRLGSDSILMNEGYRINPSVNPQVARSLLLHELQHAIQRREGFDPGANKEIYRDELGGPGNRMKMQGNLRGAKDALDILQMPGKPSLGDYSPTSSFADDFFNMHGRELSSRAQDFKDYSQAEIERVIRGIEMDFEAKQEPFEQYMRNMGEVEARNVQDRADWGMTQRRDNPPITSESRPRFKQTMSRFQYAGGGKVVRRALNWNSFLKAQRAKEGYRAAIRDAKTGKVYSGDTHEEAILSVPEADRQRVQYAFDGVGPGTVDNGFVNERGRFLNRDQLEEIFGKGESRILERFRNQKPSPEDDDVPFSGGGKVRILTEAQKRSEGLRRLLEKLMDDVDEKLKGPAAEAVTGFVGHGPKARDKDGPEMMGLMRGHALEGVARGDDPATAAMIEEAFDPVRRVIQREYGNSLPLYRVQEPVEPRGGNVINFSVPNDGRRGVLSWTSDPDFAQYYAGANFRTRPYTENEILAAEAELAGTGRVKIPRNRHTLVADPKQAPYLAIMDGDEMVTDTDSVRWFMENENEWLNELVEKARKKVPMIRRAEPTLDDVIFGTNRANQMEFMLRNRPDAPHYIDETGKGADDVEMDENFRIKKAGGGKVVGPLRYLSDKLGDVGEGFVSALERVIAGSKQSSMPAEQWKSYLAPGRKVDVEDVPFTLKKDELDWSNLPGLFEADPKAPRTAAELLEHLKKRNLPEFDERRGSTGEIDWSKPIPRAHRRYARDTVKQYEDEMGDRHKGLIEKALFDEDPVSRETAFKVLLDAGYEDETLSIRKAVMQEGNGFPTQYEDYTTRGPKQGYEENLTKWDAPPRESGDNRVGYDSPHFDENGENLLSHSRASRRDGPRVSKHFLTNTESGNRSRLFDSEDEMNAWLKEYGGGRTDLRPGVESAPGPGVRLIEEIQSDWHQAGRDKGYKTPGGPPDRWEELNDKVDKTLEEREEWARLAVGNMTGNNSDKVPDAPYKKTYPELEFRKQLLRAIAEGDEYLAWTPGEEQIERYGAGLRAVVDQIDWTRNLDGTFSVQPLRRDPRRSSRQTGEVEEVEMQPVVKMDERMQDLDERSLRNLLGKEMADQIIAQGENVPKGSLQGNMLRIGGSGMRHFYDSVVPEIAAKIARTYGGEMTEVPIHKINNPMEMSREQWNALQDATAARRNEPNYGPHATVEEFEKARNSPRFPALRITQGMRDKVRRIGVPLFGGAPVIPLSEIDFDGDGADYDYARAVSRGIVPDDTGHWPSRSELEDDEADAMGLPWGSGVLLKGKGHETWPLTEQGEADAGYKIIKRGKRYFSVPLDTDVKGDGE